MSPSLVFPPDPIDRETLLAELLGRLAVYLGGMASAETLQIFVGHIPHHLQLAFPIPSQHLVIATAMQSQTDFQLFLDAPLSPPEASDFFQSTLISEGWVQFSFGTPSVGFQPNYEGSTLHSTFHHAEKPIHLGVTVRPNASGGAEITARVLPFDRRALERSPSVPRGKGMPLPRLKSPAGTWKTGGELGGGSYAGFSDATLESPISQQEVIRHFADQLRAAGWEQIGALHLAQTLVSTWASKDADGEDIIGALAVKTVDSTPKMHYLWIFAHRLYEAPHGQWAA